MRKLLGIPVLEVDTIMKQRPRRAPSFLFLALNRFLVAGLTLGSVKG